MDRVFVDTGAFIALQDSTDQCHGSAVAYFQEMAKERFPLITTNFVLNETYTWLQRQAGFGPQAALAFGLWFREVSSETKLERLTRRRGRISYRLLPEESGGRPFGLLYGTSEVEAQAWELFAQGAGAGFTYTDCVSLAIMRMLGLERAFAFDEHFSAAGFLRLPAV